MAKFFVSALAFGLLGMINCTGYSHGSHGSVDSPTFSHHNVNVHKVAGNIERNTVPEVVISSGPIAIKMLFKSQSIDLNASQNHQNTEGKSDSSDSKDGEVVLKHSVTKPVVQYVDEEIIPSRFLSQKVHSVKEHVKTVVTKESSHGGAMPEPSY